MNYLPEGFSHTTIPEDLRRAAASRDIFEAPVRLCDENHNLIVDLGGGRTGIIPRTECAMGIAEGTVRDVAIMARVGKKVCFRVTDPDANPVTLSRRDVQEEVLSVYLRTLEPGDILEAVVTNLTAFGVFCDIGCGVTALLGIENISVSRISHSRDRFQIGQKLYAAVLSCDLITRRISLTHKELLGTWEENAAAFRPGQTVTGIVRSVKDYGAFVELTPNLSGLADYNPNLHPGDGVSVYIKSIQHDKQKIKLVALHKLDSVTPAPMTYFHTEGRVALWNHPQLVTV